MADTGKSSSADGEEAGEGKQGREDGAVAGALEEEKDCVKKR